MDCNFSCLPLPVVCLKCLSESSYEKVKVRKLHFMGGNLYTRVNTTLDSRQGDGGLEHTVPLHVWSMHRKGEWACVPAILHASAIADHQHGVYARRKQPCVCLPLCTFPSLFSWKAVLLIMWMECMHTYFLHTLPACKQASSCVEAECGFHTPMPAVPLCALTRHLDGLCAQGWIPGHLDSIQQNI